MKQHQKPKQKRSPRKRQRAQTKRRSFVFALEKKHGLLALSVFFLLACAASWQWLSARYPIDSVEVVGEHSHIESSALTQIVIPFLEPGFFRVDVQQIRSALLEEPWLQQVAVRRLWPRKLVVQLEEYQAALRFNETHMISQHGVLIDVKPTVAEQQKPLLVGPEEQWALMFSQYRHFSDTLIDTGLRITQLSLAPWGSWRLQLDNGVVVTLGKVDVDERLARFVEAYRKKLGEKIEGVATVDLRYTSGLSVGWKKKR